MNNQNSEPLPLGIKVGAGIVGFILVLVLIAIINPFVFIGAGQRGVVFNQTSGVENRVLGEGMSFRIPLVESVNKMNVRVQKSEFPEDTASKDLQRISMTVTVNWQLNPSKVNKIYQTIGDNATVVATLLTNRVQQAVKAEVSQYSAEEVQKHRDTLSDKIEKNLEGKLKGYDVIITNVSITNLDYTPEFNKAIEQKQLAQQQAEQAGYLKQKAENEAAARVAEAEGTAKARVVNAEAEAKAQQLLQQSLTPQLLQKMLIERWNGEYPKYMLGGSVPLLQLPQQ